MKKQVSDFCKWTFISAAVCLVTGNVFAAQAPNPRSGTVQNSSAIISSSSASSQRTDGREVINVGTVDNSDAASARTATERTTATVSRTATSARPSVTVSRSAATPNAVKTSTVSRSATARQTVVPTSAGNTRVNAATSRAASSNVVRTASHTPATSTARSAASNLSVVGGAIARSAAGRATAVFTDISKIGGGYATCREAYATCMDQFCANANDTYRRCFCSAKYTEFRETEAALDEAVNLLNQFESNNLNAVDKTAEEVAAMYSATEGELAIKNDTSAAASMLAEIGDLLSGNKKATTDNTASLSNSLGILDFDFSSDLEDIWSSSGSSLFDTGDGVDLASLEGQDLYAQAQKQCLQLIADSCENDAVLTMAKSAYSIMITQDCNTYEKRINSQKETVEQTVRTAEKYLREARLEEYRAHNSADVNECIDKVKSAMTTEAACGEDYKKCLDYTGAYINSSTGEPIYSPRLFELQNLISLGGINGGDVLGDNANFNSFLDSRRMFAETALDSCRDNAEIVWEEFKRQAIIEIAQAQDEKIEEVKMSCVSTMAECYDTQSGALKDFDTTTSQYAGAVSAYAARTMCQDQVVACASLYGDTEGCEFDGNGKLTVGNSTVGAAERCGLQALLDFVDTVDTVRIAEGCSAAIDSYVNDLCTPTTANTTYGYPWNCRNLSLEAFTDQIKEFAVNNCGYSIDSNEKVTTYDQLSQDIKNDVERKISDMQEDMDYLMMDICEDLNGYWVDAEDTNGNLLAVFYSNVYGSNQNNTTWGRCIENSTRVQCLNYNETGKEEVASYDLANDECTFTDAWYKTQCELLGDSYYENGVCYKKPD